MQGLTDDFSSRNPDINLEWVTLEEHVLRQRVTQDIAAKGGQFDVLTIGTYEVPIWGNNGWLVSLNDVPAEWDADDLLPAIRNGLPELRSATDRATTSTAPPGRGTSQHWVLKPLRKSVLSH